MLAYQVIAWIQNPTVVFRNVTELKWQGGTSAILAPCVAIAENNRYSGFCIAHAGGFLARYECFSWPLRTASNAGELRLKKYV